jgi:hypothetical protein
VIQLISEDNIDWLPEHGVFVFGSNYAGRHGKGAALVAKRKFGARQGQGSGLQGQSYGICTKDDRLGILPLHRIQVQVERFVRFAEAHPELDFHVTPIGCGLAGYKPREIAPMFRNPPKNVWLPRSFWAVL